MHTNQCTYQTDKNKNQLESTKIRESWIPKPGNNDKKNNHTANQQPINMHQETGSAKAVKPQMSETNTWAKQKPHNTTEMRTTKVVWYQQAKCRAAKDHGYTRDRNRDRHFSTPKAE